MADQYPYSMNYKPKPVDAFLSAFAASMEKLMMYKYQQTLQDDSAAKRLTMERQFESERQAQTAAATAADPYRQSQLRYQDAQTRKLEKELAEPEKKSVIEQYFESIGGAPSAGGGGTSPSTPAFGGRGMFGQLAATIGQEPGQGGLPAGQARTMRKLFGAEKGVGPLLAAEMVPTQESEAQEISDADQAAMEVDKTGRLRARQTGSLTGNKELDAANPKLQTMLTDLAQTDVSPTGGASLTAPGMDRLVNAATGDAAVPEFIEQRKQSWVDMVKKKEKAAKDVEDEATLNKKAAARARELGIPVSKAKDQLEGGATDPKDKTKFLDAVAKPAELSRRMQIVLGSHGTLAPDLQQNRAGYYKKFVPKDDFTPIRVQEELRQYRDELIDRGATIDEARTTINDLVERMQVYAQYDWTTDLKRVQSLGR